MDARPMSWMVRSFLEGVVRVLKGVRMLGALARANVTEQPVPVPVKRSHASPSSNWSKAAKNKATPEAINE